MSETVVREYKCPACGAPIAFDGQSGSMKCEHCGNEFSVEQIQSFNVALESSNEKESEDWAYTQTSDVLDGMKAYECPSCGGEIVCDDTVAATQCPYCGNATILPKQVTGIYAPDGIIPFKKTKDDAVKALRKFYAGKPLLPKRFTEENQIQKIQGMYVPFWMFDCDTDANITYDAKKIRTYRQGDTEVTETDHYMVTRQGTVAFDKIPVDGSTKMDDVFMESIEPFQYQDLTNFQDAYLSGYLANRYDIEPDDCLPRVNERVRKSTQEALITTVRGFNQVVPRSARINIYNSKIRYVLMPVWILSTKYHNETYTFMMNGQTGEVVGSLPTDNGKAVLYWVGITLLFVVIAILIAIFGMGGSLL